MRKRRRTSRGRRDPPPERLLEGRLNRYVARAGVCSRRAADGLIDRGLVKVNGKVVRTYWHQVCREDTVEVNGRQVSPRRFEYLLLNKPKDTISTARDEHARNTVMDLIPEPLRSRLFSVGRLDRDTIGVLLLTSDGELGHRLMHPRYCVPKRYLVQTVEPVSVAAVRRLQSGITLEDGLALADQAAHVRPEDPRLLGIELHQGRNRQIRRMIAALGHQVTRLERVGYAHLTTKGVRRGRWRRLQPQEIARLKRITGMRSSSLAHK